MKTIIKYLKLPFYFSAEQMQKEVNGIAADWIAHYNERDYEGSWTALPLRAINGSMNNVLANAGSAAAFADTQLMAQCPYLQMVIDTLPCEKMAVRLLNLKPGAIIREHRDAELNYEQGEARVHVPVMTNDAVEFYLDNERVVMQEGECWYMNFNMKHRVVNYGNTDRIHLVMDCIVNDEIRGIFNNKWEIKNLVEDPGRYSEHEKKAIVESLIRMNTPESLRMAKEMSAT